MSYHHLLERVALELRRQGLPRADVVRLVAELKDHVEDLLTEHGGTMNAQVELESEVESRLGQPEVLASAAVANRRQSSVFGRHPIWSFLIAPIPLVLVAWITLFFVCFGVLEALPWLFGSNYAIEGRAVRDWPSPLIYLVRSVEVTMRFVPPAVAAALLCWCARRGGMSWRWTTAACLLVALIAGALLVQLNLPAEPGPGNFLLGFGFGLWMYRWVNLVQLLVPLAVGALFLWNARRPLEFKS